jgi:hypothetical protein
MLCINCLRPRVDAMTLNSTGIDKTLCYQHETGGDPLCQFNSNTTTLIPSSCDSMSIAVSKDYPINSLKANLKLIVHNHESCFVSIDCIYANNIPITAGMHIKKENGSWKICNTAQSFYRIDLPQKDVSDSAKNKIRKDVETFINTFFHHRPDVIEDADDAHLTNSLKKLEDEEVSLREKLQNLSDQKQKLIKQKAERWDKIHA